jgi:hypothetical protein
MPEATPVIASRCTGRRVAVATGLVLVFATLGAAQGRSTNPAARAEYELRVERTLAIINSAPCELSTQKMERFAEELGVLAVEAGVGNAYSDLHLNTHRLSMCENKRTGGLPSFEKAVWAMFDARRFEPCGYDPGKDYGAILENVRYLTFQNRRNYDSGAMYTKIREQLPRWSVEKRQCLLDMIKRAIVAVP